jgi:hypothetical protein
MARNKRSGKIIIPHGVKIWHHELQTANALAGAGYTVEFIVTNGVRYAKSPDVMIERQKWEIKSPKTDKLSAIERNLKRATKQSENIIIDSHRMSKIHDSSIQRLLVQKCKQQRTIKKLLFINRKRQVIDISARI